MDGESWFWIAALIVIGLGLLWLAFTALMLGLTGAVLILGLAAAQGFVGIVAFIAAWIFLFPVMAVWAVGWGFIEARKHGGSEPENRWTTRTDRKPPTDPEEKYLWANRLPPYDK
ncbi:hypothetical protein [Tropicimonas sp.]|uniref:hypothetical protein n=1 Tax=Tropicimonas sp. TaxID=2067044 RepID=UPI003A85673A